MQAFITPHRARIIGIAGVACLLVGYFFYQLLPVFRAPHITLLEPQRDSVVLNPRLTIRGAVSKEARLTINRQLLYVDGDGNFTQQVYLVSGINAFEVIAEGKFGRKTKLMKYVEYRKQ